MFSIYVHLKVSVKNRFIPEMAFTPLYYLKKLIFEISNPKKRPWKKVENFGALARTSYVKDMTVAGLKIEKGIM